MILDQLIGFFSSDMGIDLGTANTLVLVKDKGIVINEPSVVAVERERYDSKAKILAVGKEAKDMVGKTPGNIEAIRPMKDGVIADFDMTEKMIRYFIEKTHRRKSFLRPRIIISVPYGLTQVERKAVRESALSAGAREVFLIEEPMAAAIGASLPIQEPKGNLVVDIGGGTTEIGVISLGGLVISKSIRTAGDKLDMSIVNYVKEKYNLIIGERTGEEIKITIGSAIQLPKELSMVVKGRDQVSGLLSRIELTSEDVREAMREYLKEIADALKMVLEMMPPDLASDIVENGVVLTGGGALIRGLDKYLSEIVRLPVYIADEPLLAVAKGTGKALEEISLLQQLTNEE
ncbi:rod shape-determining protein [Campylobacter jejuni]|uniref:Cell shape-determining protein MreB n=1 Tax=Campylobacter jejuni subsp. jejuni serotype O:2 (strain ATCC 700819 / NCTC 11168) TaxID=192222 RepID=Q0PBM9_CAMJE|nr:rod shape-determining protein [Campylobacter jejuni]YP_002343718.1 rod shape-determining protein MreB [Campylobacter jejuni subsp. jejuni NCTC 11168 = ATCC 700819]ASN47759.1 rod shape-determining protein [Campylobacter jejuni]ASQ31573.1 rod shape-determining protein [Campylobacter jejuni]EAK2587141.1 rod shape-determining protein [Campylobacter jejuni]EAK7968252.1 rod shape-determining protein [Campylobacter jejuni]EAK7969306.1 rod shape-determining protein [Campylobacter jejuni]